MKKILKSLAREFAVILQIGSILKMIRNLCQSSTRLKRMPLGFYHFGLSKRELTPKNRQNVWDDYHDLQTTK